MTSHMAFYVTLAHQLPFCLPSQLAIFSLSVSSCWDTTDTSGRGYMVKTYAKQLTPEQGMCVCRVGA